MSDMDLHYLESHYVICTFITNNNVSNESTYIVTCNTTTTMRISEKGINLIKEFEGYRSSAYKCTSGVWTIGWGHTKGVKEGDKITVAQAEKFLSSDIAKFEDYVNNVGFPNITQNQFDAIVSLAFNIGTGHFSAAKSTLYRLLANDCHNEKIITKWWICWRMSGGKVQPGLVRRREAEIKLFFSDAPASTHKLCKNPSGCTFDAQCRSEQLRILTAQRTQK